MAGLSALENATALLKEAARSDASPEVPSSIDDLKILDSKPAKQAAKAPVREDGQVPELVAPRQEAPSFLKSLGVGSRVDVVV